MPMVLVLRAEIPAGWEEKPGSYPSCAIARRTFSLVSSLMEGLSLHVLDTVEGDTPASAATSLRVTAIKSGSSSDI